MMTPAEQGAYTRGFNAGKERKNEKLVEAESIIRAFDTDICKLDRKLKDMILLNLTESKAFSDVKCIDMIGIANEISGNCYNMIQDFVEERRKLKNG